MRLCSLFIVLQYEYSYIDTTLPIPGVTGSERTMIPAANYSTPPRGTKIEMPRRGGGMVSQKTSRRDKAAPIAPSAALAEACLSNDDILGIISSWLGGWRYLDLALVCKTWAVDTWAYVLRILARAPGVDELVHIPRQVQTMGWPAKVLHVRSIAFSLGLNANGLGLAATLRLLARTYPELEGLKRNRRSSPACAVLK